jgi:tRNA pseudouridine38-40 synthase
MRNIKLTIEYDGTDFAGWQLQPGERTVQAVIEKALAKVLGEKVRVIASGRTDSGVHAKAQAANFKTKNRIPLLNLQKALNSNLPKDIVISKIEKVDPDFHSRFDAKSKVYRYRLLNRSHRSAFLKNTVCFYPYPLDVGLMRREAKCLLGRHDFKSFCTSGTNTKDTMRTIKRIQITRQPIDHGPSTIDCIIEADGFLYNMARNIVGTLVEIGRGRLSAGSAARILKARDRRAAGPTMPARGLCLMEVKYR